MLSAGKLINVLCLTIQTLMLSSVSGCSGRIDKPAAEANQQEEDHQPRLALPKEWVGRWQPDPFAGTEWIEVQHQSQGGGTNKVYLVKDAKAVESLLHDLKVIGIQNDVARGSIPASFLTFHKKDGTDLRSGVERDQCLGTHQGIIFLRSEFFTALNRQLTDQEHHPVNVLEFLPSAPLPQPAPPVKASANSLTSGFNSISVQYMVDKRLHRAMIKDRKTLDELQKILTIQEQESSYGVPRQSRTLIIESKDGSTFYGDILSPTEFCDSNAGKFKVSAAFLKSLNQIVSRLEGFPIDLAGDNVLSESQVKQDAEVRGLLGEVKSIKFSSGKKTEWVTVDDPGQVAELIKSLAWIEVPVAKTSLKLGKLFVELTTKTGNKLEMTRLQTGNNNELVPAAPLSGDLVELTGIGPVWIDDQWKYRLEQFVFDQELQAKQKRALETVNLVARDFPAFLKQVLNVVADYRHGGDQQFHCMTAADSRPIINALADGKIEKLDWTPDRWKKELDALFKREAGSLDLTPGLGFSLMVVVSRENEILVPEYGKLTFEKSPIPVFQKAIAGQDYQPDTIHLQPR